MVFSKNTAHVVYASDDKFSEILGVSLLSLFYNSRDMENITIYILDNGISVANKQKLENICDTYKRSLPVWLKANDIGKELSIKMEISRGSLSQFSRIFVSRSLPQELERVLYLDCDIIVNRSIRELWDLDLHDKTIAALMEGVHKFYRAEINLPSNDTMFNSGVMLIDLKRWREKQIEEKLLAFIIKKNGKIHLGDQGALNAILSHDTYCFEPRFNSITVFYDFTYEDMMIFRKPRNYYTKEQIRLAVENPSIIHFNTSFLSKRPWEKGCQHIYVGEWIKFKDMSPWKEEALWEDNKLKWKQNIIRIYKALPNWLVLNVAGLMHAYGRPIIRVMKNEINTLKRYLNLNS